MSLRIALVAGEASGDQLGAGLVRELKRLRPDLECEGVAGKAMTRAGCLALADSESLAVMGLVEPLREIPRLLRLRRELIRRWTTHPPAVFVGIDAPDFNLGLELALKRAGIRTVQYVSPSVWAWRQGRLAKIARAVDKVLCLLPFEKAFYDRHGVAADFVGHPLADRLQPGPPDMGLRETLGLPTGSVVAVLPGSRSSEVARLGPVFAEACRRLLDGQAHDAMRSADVVLLASGTAALEAALLGRPIVAAYRLAPLTYALARSLRLVKVRHFTLPNLLTDAPLVPEFLQGGATPAALADALQGLLQDPERRTDIAREFAKLRDQLARGADRLAARAVLELAVRE